jgi:hypothetical protein
MIRRITLVVCLVAGLMPARPVKAQTPPIADTRGRLVVTIVDQTGGVLPNAKVTLTGEDDATKTVTIDPATTTAAGVATIERLTPGRYTIQAEFPGFETVTVRDVRVRAGETKRSITLPLKKLAEDMTVGRDKQSAALDPIGLAFSTVLTREQIAALPDDPDEMAAVLQAMAPPGSTIRVDGFTGGRLPPKSQIRSIRLPRMDMMAAQNHGGLMGAHFIDIMTQPGIGPFRASTDFTVRDDALNARNPFAPVKGDERLHRFGLSLSGTISPNRTSYSFSAQGGSQYDTTMLLAAEPGFVRAEPVRQPIDHVNFTGRIDHALNRDHSLRASVQRVTFERRNQGVGGFDLAERAYASETADTMFRISENGPLGRRFFSESRLQLRWTSSQARSAIEAPTIRVLDAFTSGGAQRRGGGRTLEFEAATDLDYVRGAHSMRAGILAEGGRFRSDDMSNYLGTYTFANLDDYEAGRPATYTRRIGDPFVSYSNIQLGLYVQDDYRLARSLLLSYGLRYEVQTLVDDPQNFSPRATLSWVPWKSGKTTLRGGVGRFSDWMATSTYEQTQRLDGFRYQEFNVINPTFPDPGLGLASPANRYALSDGLVLPESLSANAGIDQALTSSLRVNATYTYRRGSHLLRGRNLNAPVDGVRPDPRFTNAIEVQSDAASRVHTVNVGANLLMLNWKRTIVSGNYTWTGSESNTTGAFGLPAYGDDISADWGVNAPRHRAAAILSTSPIANLGVMLNLRASSGAPYTITTGADDNRDGVFNERPDGVSRGTERMANQLDAALRVSYAIGFGRAPQSTGGPGGATVVMMGGSGGMTGGFTGGADSSRYRLEFYASAQNLTNRRNYVGYSGVLTSPFFGQPTNVLNPRKVEIGVRFGF